MRGDPKDEKTLLCYFAEHRRRDKGARTEYLWPAMEVAHYVNWLRQWWWVAISSEDDLGEFDAVACDLWCPSPDRVLAPPEPDPARLIQSHVALEGPLAGTAWDWMVSPRQSIQGLFHPSRIDTSGAISDGRYRP